jgi:hypothetical protein
MSKCGMRDPDAMDLTRFLETPGNKPRLAFEDDIEGED